MLNVIVHKLGDATVLHCQGRIVIGPAYAGLRCAVVGQANSRTLVLDLAQVDLLDAGGLGVLLELRAWTRSNAIQFKLMNVTDKVLQVLELTKLDRVFEFCSVRDMFHLLHCAVWASSPIERPGPADWQESPATVTVKGDRLQAAAS